MVKKEPANKRLAVTESTLKRVMSKAHYGQTQNGVITELLDSIEYNYINEVNRLLSTGSLKKCNKHGTLFLGFESCSECNKESEVK
jgi:hypothetical protein